MVGTLRKVTSAKPLSVGTGNARITGVQDSQWLTNKILATVYNSFLTHLGT